jgi:hypothetical protein
LKISLVQLSARMLRLVSITSFAVALAGGVAITSFRIAEARHATDMTACVIMAITSFITYFFWCWVFGLFKEIR